jgi:hypothetical protein
MTDETMRRYFETLDRLRDRLLRSGYLLEHGNSDGGGIVSTFTKKGLGLVSVVKSVETEIGKLSGNEAACLWLYLSEHGKFLNT